MAAIAYTFVRATPYQLIYSWTGDAAGTLAYSVYSAQTVSGPLKVAIDALNAETDSAAKATAAVITGAPFVGAVTASVTSNIQTTTIVNLIAAGFAPPELTAADSGAGNTPDIVLTPDAGATEGFIFITKRPEQFV